jgi:hypothetical protein
VDNGLTQEEREALKKRMSELKVRMGELRRRATSTDIAEWAELYAEREALEKQLGDED